MKTHEEAKILPSQPKSIPPFDGTHELTVQCGVPFGKLPKNSSSAVPFPLPGLRKAPVPSTEASFPDSPAKPVMDVRFHAFDPEARQSRTAKVEKRESFEKQPKAQTEHKASGWVTRTLLTIVCLAVIHLIFAGFVRDMLALTPIQEQLQAKPGPVDAQAENPAETQVEATAESPLQGATPTASYSQDDTVREPEEAKLDLFDRILGWTSAPVARE